MKRLASLFLVGLVTACAANAPEPSAESQAGPRPASTASAPVCRLGIDGGPLIADRGIGGTGAPTVSNLAGTASSAPSAAAVTRVADRGIGGTGIGGTGIVGVITGFASVCVNGLEVAYDNNASVDLNGTAATVSALRAGQVVVIQADGAATTLHARTISVRQEVSGRIEAVELGSGVLTIAGLPVSVPPGTWGANRFGLGDWVSVSGLQREDGVIVASRLDDAPSGVFSARGRVERNGDLATIGRLTLTAPMANSVRDNQFVIVTGTYNNGEKQIRTVSADPLFAGASGYFGQSVDHLVMQAFVRVANGAVWVNGLKVRALPNLRGQAGSDGIAVVSLERMPDGSFGAIGLRDTDFRIHATPAPQGSRRVSPGKALSLPTPTRHAALTTPAGTDGTGSSALTSFQPTATSTYLPPSAGQAVGPSTSPLVVTTAPANTITVNLAPVTTIPAVIAPVSTTPVANPMINMPVVAGPTIAATPPAPVVPVDPSTVFTPPPPVQSQTPATGVPQVESIGSALISSNDGPSTRASAAAVRSGVLSAPVVHARSVPAVTTTATISLVTTIGTATPPAGSSLSAPGVSGTIGSKRSTLITSRAGRH